MSGASGFEMFVRGVATGVACIICSAITRCSIAADCVATGKFKAGEVAFECKATGSAKP